MNQTTKRILFTLLIMTVVLTACAPAAAPAPTQDPAVVQQQIEQAVQATIEAQNARATEQQALIVPSNTPLPTQTETVAVAPTIALPTATPLVIVPPTVAPVTGGGGGGAPVVVAKDYDCTVGARLPLDGAVYKPGNEFDIKWTIKNTGTKVIRAGTDLKYYSGGNFVKVDLVELPELKPGATTTIILDAKAPSKGGQYIMTWVVEGQLCFPHTVILVQK